MHTKIRIDKGESSTQFSHLRADLTRLRFELLSQAPVVENLKDGTLLVEVPEGSFLAGGVRNEEGQGPFSVHLPSYYMGLHAVTNAQYARFLNNTHPTDDEIRKWIQMEGACCVRQTLGRFEAFNAKDDHPVVMVSWFGAQAYCRWAGLRLPTELEWDKASRGVDGRDYPWGDEWAVMKCQTFENSCGGMTCSVWDYPDGTSPWGVSQMAGNVSEWCNDWYDARAYQRYKRGELVAPGAGTKRSVRGGAWVYTVPVLFRCAYRDFACEPGTQAFHIGFRCARSI